MIVAMSVGRRAIMPMIVTVTADAGGAGPGLTPMAGGTPDHDPAAGAEAGDQDLSPLAALALQLPGALGPEHQKGPDQGLDLIQEADPVLWAGPDQTLQPGVGQNQDLHLKNKKVVLLHRVLEGMKVQGEMTNPTSNHWGSCLIVLYPFIRIRVLLNPNPLVK